MVAVFFDNFVNYLIFVFPYIAVAVDSCSPLQKLFKIEQFSPKLAQAIKAWFSFSCFCFLKSHQN